MSWLTVPSRPMARRTLRARARSFYYSHEAGIWIGASVLVSVWATWRAWGAR